MNTAEYIGRLVTEPMLNRKVNMEEEHYWSRIRIAVPRKFKKDREKETDFFNCLFFDQAAKYLCQYAKKGGRIYVRGENRENNYEKDGVKNIRTEYPESLFVIFTGFHMPEKIMRGNLKVQSEKIIELIIKELKEKNYGYAMNCENLLNMLFVLLQRERNAQDEEKISSEIRKKNCEKVNRYVQKHYLDSPQMEFLATKFGYSGNTQMLRRDFLRFFGRTPTEIIKTKRIEEAKRLLETTNEGNKEIAEKLGYNSDSYFGMDFKKSTGMTPATYRKKKKKEKIEKIMKGDYQMELKDYLA